MCSMKCFRRANETQVDIRLKSETDFNLIKIYCALKEIIARIETELNIMEQTEGEH
jgi:hypothetical protein